jgi:predicted DCC family thiol-disulfide oxidoreductase YuxK
MVSLWRAGPGVLVFNTVLVAAVAVVTPWPSWQSREATRAPVSEPIILFDGVCGLCNWLVDFMLRRDRRATVRFQPLQAGAFSPAPDLDSVLVWHGARLYQESDAILYALAQLGGPWRMLRVLAAIPPSLRNAVYRFVARRRYAWFGRRATCRIPTTAQSASFLDAELSGRP